MKIIISEGKISKTIEIPKEKEIHLYGLKIGQIFDGKIIGVDKKLKITGGSSKDGFPMLKSIEGSKKARILKESKKVNKRKKKTKKMKVKAKKTVVGNTVNENIAALNVVVVEG